jgi:hypothetical protein
MDNEGLRLGLFLGGVVMAAVPISVGVGFAIFFYKQFKQERLQREGAHQQGETP